MPPQTVQLLQRRLATRSGRTVATWLDDAGPGRAVLPSRRRPARPRRHSHDHRRPLRPEVATTGAAAVLEALDTSVLGVPEGRLRDTRCLRIGDGDTEPLPRAPTGADDRQRRVSRTAGDGCRACA